MAKTKSEAIAKVAEDALPKAETRALWSDVALRTATRLFRTSVLDSTLNKVMTPAARAQAKPNSLGMSLLGMMAARMATKSVPGAVLVSGALIAKALYDRGAAKKADADAQEIDPEQTAGQKDK